MSMRKITNTGSRKNIGKLPSLKMKRNIWWESLLERDYMLFLEHDADVVGYCEQPLRIHVRLEGKHRRYTPDLLIERKHKRQIVEVKPAAKLLTGRYDALFSAASTVCREHGYEFVVATDAQIRVEPRLSNLKLFWRYARTPLQPRHQLLCREFFRARAFAAASLDELSSHLASEGVGRDVLFAMLHHGAIAVDPNTKLDEARLTYPRASRGVLGILPLPAPTMPTTAEGDRQS